MLLRKKNTILKRDSSRQTGKKLNGNLIDVVCYVCMSCTVGKSNVIEIAKQLTIPT